VDGGQNLRFSPRHPKKVLQLSTPAMALSETQRDMYVLNLSADRFKTSTDDAVNLDKIDIGGAADFRNMRFVSSTWDRENDRISDSYLTKGRKIITFSNILKYNSFPLAEILSTLLNLGRSEMKTHVELEFAVNMDVKRGDNMIFNFLQIRPVVDDLMSDKLDWENIDTTGAIVYAESALGLGRIKDVCDVIYINEDTFTPSQTELIAAELDSYNKIMIAQNRNYVLIGPGRWGSSDPWLGIPIKWSNISQARVIVESGLKNFRVDPSQGTHFFQNFTSLGAGYMTVNPYIGDGSFDISQLNAMEAVYESKFIRHVRYENPLYIFIDGRSNRGIIRREL
ncbi:MAG: phosphoenolpyruvate synthase, partial [Rikenellaceae bacterium]